MGHFLEKYATITSSDYSGSISIPLALERSCKQISLRNRSEDIPVTVIVKGISTDVQPGETLVDHYEKEEFRALSIETQLGHNFILELYRD